MSGISLTRMLSLDWLTDCTALSLIMWDGLREFLVILAPLFHCFELSGDVKLKLKLFCMVIRRSLGRKIYLN